MVMFLCGLALLYVAFGDRFWQLVGWAPADDEPDWRANYRSWIKLVASVLSIIFLVYGFPAIPEGVSHAGCVAAAIVLLIVGLTDFPWKQEMFKSLMDDDDDYKFGYGIVRIIAAVIGIVLLLVGVGTGHEDWLWSWELQAAMETLAPVEVVSQ